MTIHWTRYDLKRNFSRILNAGHKGNIYYLFYCTDRVGYNAGIYGWNYDIFNIGNTAITAGYRTIGIVIPFDLMKKYNDKAKKIVLQRKDYKEMKSELEILQKEFIAEYESMERNKTK